MLTSDTALMPVGPPRPQPNPLEDIECLFDDETLALVLPPSLYDDREVYPTSSRPVAAERLQPDFLMAQ